MRDNVHALLSISVFSQHLQKNYLFIYHNSIMACENLQTLCNIILSMDQLTSIENTGGCRTVKYNN